MGTYLVLELHSGPEWDKSRPMEEQSDWLAHASFMDGLVDSGFVVLGGPLDDHRVVLIVEADSEDAIRTTLATDPGPLHLVVRPELVASLVVGVGDVSR